MRKKIKLGVLVSGRGSNLQAIIEACQKTKIDAEVAVVISNIPRATALEKAEQHSLKTVCLDQELYTNKTDLENQIIKQLKEAKVDLVILAGFIRLLSSHFVAAFRHRILNIHPALLPSFPGLHAQRQALDYGVKYSGCTVHFVDEGCDTGPIIIQAVVPILENDTEETLAQRILDQEHKIYPQAIQLFAEGRLKIEGRRVKILPKRE